MNTLENTQKTTTRSETISNDRFEAMEAILKESGIITDEEWPRTGGVSFQTTKGAVRITPVAFNGRDWKCDITTSKTTPVYLDAALVAKITASITAIRRGQPFEAFVEDLLVDMLLPISGMFEGLIEDEDEPDRQEIEAELKRIRSL